MMRSISAILIIASFGIFAHEEGLSEIVEFRVNPGVLGRDSFSICVDLGKQSFAANDAIEFRNQNLRVTFGELDLKGKTDDSGRIDCEVFKVKLSDNGKKLHIEAKGADLGFLLDPQPQPGTFPASCELKIALTPTVTPEQSPRVIFVRELYLKFEKESDKKR